MGYGDYVIDDSMISRVYYVEGLGHNLFSVGKFCDSDLKVAFRKHSCFVCDTDGVDLLKVSRSINLYTIYVDEMMKSSLICLLSKASKNKSWLWHHRLNHLNFGTINDLARNDLFRDIGTEFVNQVMIEFYKRIGLFLQKSVPRTPQQNGVVKRRNHTLVEAARTIEDLGKLQATADIRIFLRYAPSKKGYKIYNKRTRRIMETIHAQFDELNQTMAPVHISSGPEPSMMTPGQLNSGLSPSQVLKTPYVPPTNKELEILFQPMFDEYFELTRDDEPVPFATAVNAQVVPPCTSMSTTFAQDAYTMQVTDIIKRTKSKQNQTKPSTKWKAWKSQKSNKVNKKSTQSKSKSKTDPRSKKC
nr:integrase, catalytic region, zinc finger, CCHC-type, peptidase aspartic, catalytic [Tanacetum cinerariifolium]